MCLFLLQDFLHYFSLHLPIFLLQPGFDSGRVLLLLEIERCSVPAATNLGVCRLVLFLLVARLSVFFSFMVTADLGCVSIVPSRLANVSVSRLDTNVSSFVRSSFV